MSENHIADVAKILGVELGEKFDLIKHGVDMDNPYYLTEQGLFDNKNKICPSFMISEIIFGHLEIIKKPWVPEEDEPYWFLTYEGKAVPDRFKDYFSSVHQMRVRLGNFFKTEEEAKSYKEKWLAYYNQGADMSWRV